MIHSHGERTDPPGEPPDSVQAAIAGPEDTRKSLLAGQVRGYTQIRNLLVQLPENDANGNRSSVLARAVTGRRHRELLLYLLLLGARPVVESQQEREPLAAAVWIRALTAPGEPPWSTTTLSRAWSHLEEMELITARREKRAKWVAPCREDGTGVPYERPGGRSGRENHYFILPDSFWHSGLFGELSLPGLAMFLLFLKETNNEPDFKISADRVEDWYGISRRSAQNGIENLEANAVLLKRHVSEPEPLSASGYTTRIYYSLTGDFSYTSRRALQEEAAAVVTKRAADAAARALAGEPPAPAKKTLKKPKRGMEGVRGRSKAA